MSKSTKIILIIVIVAVLLGVGIHYGQRYFLMDPLQKKEPGVPINVPPLQAPPNLKQQAAADVLGDAQLLAMGGIERLFNKSAAPVIVNPVA